MSLIPMADLQTLSARQKESYDRKIARDGRVTNMQRTLLHSAPAFDVYMGWYDLRDRLTPIFGDRAIWVFCHVISEGTDCLICSTFFRRLLTDAGISPDSYTPTDEEKLLESLGRSFLNNGHGVDQDVWRQLRERYDNTVLTDLIAFGGMMVANNLFNNIIDPELDEYLHDYKK